MSSDSSGVGFVGCALQAAAPGADADSGGAHSGGAHTHANRREVVVNGTRVKTVDIHAHCAVPEAMAVIDQHDPAAGLLMSDLPTRIAAMDVQGLDVSALSINPYWYHAERDAAAEVIRIQNEALVEICETTPDRFVAFATAALQHPDLAVEQVEHASKKLGFKGVSVGGSVEGLELADPKFHPFWAKCEELGMLVFMHPTGTT
jgi:aminocarboxymuconate-semialdehyde decarboxylase